MHAWNRKTNGYLRGFLLDETAVLGPKLDRECFQTLNVWMDESRASIYCDGEKLGEFRDEPMPDIHPAFLERENNSIFHSLTAASDVLKDEV